MKYFQASEYQCKCGCGLKKIKANLAIVVDAIREDAGVPIRVNSGCRCESHNKTVGGSPRSQHLPDKKGYCGAMDLSSHEKTPRELEMLAIRNGAGGIGRNDFKNFVHVDVRESLSKGITRWCYDKNGKQIPWYP